MFNRFNGNSLGNIFSRPNANNFNQMNSQMMINNFKNAISNLSDDKLQEIKLQAKKMGISDNQINQGMDFINSMRSSNK